VTGWVLVKRRSGLAAVLGGAMTGLGAVGFSVLVFREGISSKLAAIGTTLIGCLPGIVLVVILCRLQDRLFPVSKGRD
jgi:hypothetical protein